MPKFCGKCGARLDEKTGLCPNCDADRLKELQEQDAVQYEDEAQEPVSYTHLGKDLPDVTDRYAWYMPYFQYCVENGIIHAEEVSPMGLDDQSITRYEMVEILNKAVSDEQMEPILDLANGDIPDVDENSEYGLEVYRWYRAGVLIGNEGGLFCGENSLTRAEVAAILCRLYGLLE